MNFTGAEQYKLLSPSSSNSQFYVDLNFNVN